MKTRIIQTRFWDDDIVQSVSKDSIHLWIFLLTNKELGMTCYTRIPDNFIQLYTKLTSKELEFAKQELQSTKKVFFYKNWIYIPKLETQNNYKKSPSNKANYEKELSIIPSDVKTYFDSVLGSVDSTPDTSVDSTGDSTQKQEIRNIKQENENKKLEEIQELETKKKAEEEQALKNKQEQEKRLRKVVDYYNKIFGKKIESTKGFEDNFDYWIKVHPLDKIFRAIDGAFKDKFWKDKIDLTILFRKKNPQGEKVDNIEKFTNCLQVVNNHPPKISNYVVESSEKFYKTLKAKPTEELTDGQKKFLRNYEEMYIEHQN